MVQVEGDYVVGGHDSLLCRMQAILFGLGSLDSRFLKGGGAWALKAVGGDVVCGANAFIDRCHRSGMNCGETGS
jgi:hypothetical protein